MSQGDDQEKWWAGWAIPICILSNGAIILRVVGEMPSGGIWDTMRHLMSLHLWKKNTDALFIYFEPGPKGKLLSFQFNILPIEGGAYVDRMYTAFQHDPKSGADLRRAMFWVLFDLLGIETPWSVAPPRGIAPTPQAELFLPKPVYDVPLTRATEMSAQISTLDSIEAMLRPTFDLLTLLRDTDFIVGSEELDEREPDREWFTWQIYMGGPKIYRLMVEKYEDEPAFWSVASSDGRTITDDFDTPLDALLAVPIWWPNNDPEGYIEAFTPDAEWWPELKPILEPYLLLEEMPLAWPLPKLEEWAKGVGLL